MTTEMLLPAKPTSVTVELVRGCNLDCTMCLGSGDRKPRLAERRLVVRIVEQIRSLDLQWVRFCGDGEPTLHPQLPEFAALIRKARVPIVGFVTNGTRLFAPLVEHLRDAGLNFVAVSLDAATEATFARIRRGNVPLSVVENNLRALLEFRARTGWAVEVQANFVVQPGNEDEVDLFVARWAGQVDRVNLLRLTSLNGARNPSAGPCYMARSKLYVSVDGDIFPCFYLHAPAEPIGSVSTETIADVWSRQRRAVALNPAAPATRLCSRCTYSDQPWERKA